ncbi:MAG: FAD-binding protein [Christensenellales bacterium]
MKVLVVGAGASGLFAAYSATTHTEAKVTVAEKTKSGKKFT